MSSYRSPLGRARGLGSAKDGVHHWWSQRVTAVALVPLALWFAFSIASLAGAPHSVVIAWIAEPFVAIVLILTLIATFWHAHLGVQVIVEDYVSHEFWRPAGIVISKLVLFALATAAVFAVLRIAFTA